MNYSPEVRSMESSIERGVSGPARLSLPGTDQSDRITELERENTRLQMLVAELLIKNQRLRRED